MSIRWVITFKIMAHYSSTLSQLIISLSFLIISAKIINNKRLWPKPPFLRPQLSWVMSRKVSVHLHMHIGMCRCTLPLALNRVNDNFENDSKWHRVSPEWWFLKNNFPSTLRVKLSAVSCQRQLACDRQKSAQRALKRALLGSLGPVGPYVS